MNSSYYTGDGKRVKVTSIVHVTQCRAGGGGNSLPVWFHVNSNRLHSTPRPTDAVVLQIALSVFKLQRSYKIDSNSPLDLFYIIISADKSEPITCNKSFVYDVLCFIAVRCFCFLCCLLNYEF